VSDSSLKKWILIGPLELYPLRVPNSKDNNSEQNRITILASLDRRRGWFEISDPFEGVLLVMATTD
jgi:hypothetical protein